MDAVHERADFADQAALLAEIGQCKRITRAGLTGSLADALFGSAWASLVTGVAPGEVALDLVADAVRSVVLGPIDPNMLAGLGLDEGECALVADRAMRSVAERLPHGLSRNVAGRSPLPSSGDTPSFVAALRAQPRAGATRPGYPRLPITPTESHADHCAMVAVGGVILAEYYHADRGTVLLAGLAHHLHNARLPDAGFAGEEALGETLGPLMARLFAAEIATLPPALGIAVRHALDVVGDATTAEGQAFVAADVIDRVLQVRYHAAVAGFRAEDALGEMELVHPGPLQAFQLGVLRQAALA